MNPRIKNKMFSYLVFNIDYKIDLNLGYNIILLVDEYWYTIPIVTWSRGEVRKFV